MIEGRKRRPSLPGEILGELYLTPYNVSIAKFAEAVGVPRKHMSAIVNGRAAITADTPRGCGRAWYDRAVLAEFAECDRFARCTATLGRKRVEAATEVDL
jgi:hypothetical protein